MAPYYNRPRRTPPRSGTTLFVAGLNFVTTERVRLWSMRMLTGWQFEQHGVTMIGLKPGMPLPDDLLGGGTHLWSLLLQEVEAKFEKFGGGERGPHCAQPCEWRVEGLWLCRHEVRGGCGLCESCHRTLLFKILEEVSAFQQILVVMGIAQV